MSAIRNLILLTATLLAACVRFRAEPIAPGATLDGLESRSLTDSAVARFVQANHQAATWPPDRWNLRALTLVAFYYHPDLDVARGTWAEARGATVTAGQRIDPDAAVAAGYNSSATTNQATPWITSLDLGLTIETGGKRGHRLAQAQRIADAARIGIASAAWRVRSRVRRSLLDLFGAEAMARLLEQRQRLQQSTMALLERQLAAGAISPFELTQARLLHDAARLALLDAQRQRDVGLVTLAASLGVTRSALDGIVLSYDVFDEPTPAVPEANVRRQALLSRADVLGALMEYEASQAGLQLEISRQYPDIRLGPGFQMDQGENKWTLGLGGVLPVFTRNAGPIAEAGARRVTAAARFDVVQSRAIEEIDGAMAGYRNAIVKLATADSMLGDRQRLLRTAEAQFTAGDISRLELGLIEIELTNIALARTDALLGVQHALGGLEDATQGPVDLVSWLTDGPARRLPRDTTIHKQR